MQRASDYLGKTGPFCEQLPGYQVRDNQLNLCDAIEAGPFQDAAAEIQYRVPASINAKGRGLLQGKV